MGFQVTPCMNMASPESEAHERMDCAGSTKYLSPCTPSLSLRSHSANFLLSQCTSLASLPSLCLSFNGSSDPGRRLLAEDSAASNITAHFSCLATLTGLGDQVACSVSSPADSFFYSSSAGCASHSLKAWPKQGGGSYQSAAFGSKKDGAVRAIVVVGDQVLSSHDDLKIRVWATPGSATTEGSCTGGGGGGGSSSRGHKLLAALPTAWDCMARTMEPGGYVQVRRHHKKLWIQHTDAISALAVDAKEGCLYSASWDRSVKVWRLRDFKCIESFRAHDDAINALALSKEGILYTASADCKIKVWARETSSARRRPQHYLVATLEAHRSAVNALALSPDGSLLYSGACDKAIVVWEREDSAQHTCLAGALRGHRQAVLCLAAWGNTLCSGSADNSIRVWQRLAGGRLHACVALLPGHAAPVRSLSLVPDDARSSDAKSALTLYSASLDHEVKVWQLRLSFSH